MLNSLMPSCELLKSESPLRDVLPEVYCLFGVPQGVNYHGECDTGIHTMLAIQYAANKGYDALVRLGALLHDVGKGVTPTDALPAHHKHEVVGGQVVQAMFERVSFCDWLESEGLYAIESTRDFVVYCATRHLALVKYRDLNYKTVLNEVMVLQGLFGDDGFDMLVRALRVCECDKEGRMNQLKRYLNEFQPVNDHTAMYDFWTGVYNVVRQEGFQKDSANSQEYHVARLNAVKRFMKNVF